MYSDETLLRPVIVVRNAVYLFDVFPSAFTHTPLIYSDGYEYIRIKFTVFYAGEIAPKPFKDFMASKKKTVFKNIISSCNEII